MCFNLTLDILGFVIWNFNVIAALVAVVAVFYFLLFGIFNLGFLCTFSAYFAVFNFLSFGIFFVLR